MFVKFVFLLSVSAALAYHLQVTPEDLRTFFENVDTEVKVLQHESEIEIRDNLIPLYVQIGDAKSKLISNITDAAKPYWDKISSLEETAKEKGQDIEKCVDLGNKELYALNNSIANTAYYWFNYYNQSGYDILISSSSEAYSVVEELVALGEVVALCNDDTCATDLKKTVTQFYSRAKSTISDAETKASNYVNIYLPPLLTQWQLDSNTYVANYTVFLSDVTTCINNL